MKLEPRSASDEDLPSRFFKDYLWVVESQLSRADAILKLA